MAEKTVELDKMDQPLPLWLMLLMPVYMVLVMSIFVFPVAGDWGWNYGWLFVATLTLNMTISYLIINQKNPRVIRNRTKLKKTGLNKDTRQAASSDRFVFPLMTIGFFGAIILPGLGYRFAWTILPLPVAIGGAVLMNIGLVILNMATLQNSYASKLLDINKDQVLVDTGLYAHVRHPLYSGGVIMALFMPITMGSLWGLLPALLAALILVVRIKFEEDMLIKGMAGYEDYRARVKYKLIPGIY